MDREVREVQLAFDVIERPFRVGAIRLVTGVGTGCRVAKIDAASRAILNAADVPAAAAHHEASVPAVGQQHRKPDLAADPPVIRQWAA